MIREKKFKTSDCHTCRRPGWRREIHFNVFTEEEQLKLFGHVPEKDLKGAPRNAEKLWVGAGSDIGSAIKEAKEVAELMDKPMAFNFNEQLVVVTKYTDVDECYREWWQKMYKETPEQSFARR